MLEQVTALCTVAVIFGVVHSILPEGNLSVIVKVGTRLLLATMTLSIFMQFDFSEFSDISSQSVNSEYAENYVSERLADSLCDEVEEQVKAVLEQFGIEKGQISIDCTKGKYGDVQLEHIGVTVPKENAEKREAIKRLLLKKFDVFCDVSVGEVNDDSE